MTTARSGSSAPKARPKITKCPAICHAAVAEMARPTAMARATLAAALSRTGRARSDSTGAAYLPGRLRRPAAAAHSATVVMAKPDSSNTAMRWRSTACIAANVSTEAAVNRVNLGSTMRCRTLTATTSLARGVSSLLKPSGAAAPVTRRIPPRTAAAHLQPSASTSRLVTGRNTGPARPPTTVSTAMLRRRPASPNHRSTATKAGS